MRRALPVVFTMVGVAMAGCGSGSSTTEPSSVRSLAGQPLTPCSVGPTAALCGTLPVPEDRGQPTGRQIGLRVVVVPATQTASPDPLFLLAGGPGGAATTQFKDFVTALARVRQHRDIVLVDQRGTGSSNPLVVPEAPDLSGLEPDESSARYQAWLRKALLELPGDVRFYTTTVAASDLDAVREALGYDTIDLYGGSYGGTAAQYYMRQYPGRVRSVVLDGAAPVEIPLFERTAANAQRALDLLFARCAADGRCSSAFPDFAAEFRTVLTRLQDAPVETTIVDPRTGRAVVVKADDFVAAAHQFLMQAEGAAAMPYYAHQAFLERWDLVVPAALSAQVQAFDSSRLAMAIVIKCSEAWARYDPEETARHGAGSFEADLQVAGAEPGRRVRGHSPRCRAPGRRGSGAVASPRPAARRAG